VICRIEYDPAVEDHFCRLSARDEAIVPDAIVLQLTHEPTVPPGTASG